MFFSLYRIAASVWWYIFALNIHWKMIVHYIMYYYVGIRIFVVLIELVVIPVQYQYEYLLNELSRNNRVYAYTIYTHVCVDIRFDTCVGVPIFLCIKNDRSRIRIYIPKLLVPVHMKIIIPTAYSYWI